MHRKMTHLYVSTCTLTHVQALLHGGIEPNSLAVELAYGLTLQNAKEWWLPPPALLRRHFFLTDFFGIASVYLWASHFCQFWRKTICPMKNR